MSVTGVAFRLLDGRQAVERGDDDLLALHAECCAGDGSNFTRQWHVWRRQPGFALAEAMHGGFLVGYAAGMPLRPSTSWWKDVTTPLPASVTQEHPGRTFAVTALMVRAAWRRQGIGTELHSLLLRDRPEERAALSIPGSAGAAQRALRAWGWDRVARTPGGLLFLAYPLPGGLPLSRDDRCQRRSGNAVRLGQHSARQPWPEGSSRPRRAERPQPACGHRPTAVPVP